MSAALASAEAAEATETPHESQPDLQHNVVPARTRAQQDNPLRSKLLPKGYVQQHAQSSKQSSKQPSKTAHVVICTLLEAAQNIAGLYSIVALNLVGGSLGAADCIPSVV